MEIVGVVELVADRLLGFDHVGDDDVGLGAQSGAHRIAIGVEHGEHAEGAELADQAPVDVGRDARRGAARHHADRRALGEVEKLGDELVDLDRADLGAALVDLGLLARGRVDDREVRPRLAERSA